MSRKRIEVRLTLKDRELLDTIAESIDGSRSSAVKFLLRNYKNHRQSDVAPPIA